MSDRFLIAAGENPRAFAKELNNIPPSYSAYTRVTKHGGELYQIFERGGDAEPPPDPVVALDQYIYSAEDYLTTIEECMAEHERVSLRLAFGLTAHLVRLDATATYLYLAYRAEHDGIGVSEWDVQTSGKLAELLFGSMRRMLIGKVPSVDVAAFLKTGKASHRMAFLEEAYGVRFQLTTVNKEPTVALRVMNAPEEVVF